MANETQLERARDAVRAALGGLSEVEVAALLEGIAGERGFRLVRPLESINRRSERALDEVLEILKTIRVSEVRGLLNDVATEYERLGPRPAEILVVGKRDHTQFKDKRQELNGLVQIIGVLERERLPRAEAGYILKKLEAIAGFYQPVKEE
ncbi:MAG: hypothetical protein FJ014_12370 [Chloroflexi bacterium]|nr:hypothetical protein [Chloroflexota bacterium]